MLVKEAMGTLEIEIEKSNAKIHISELPVVEVIPSLMQQLFYNLINNAIKFRKKLVDPVIHIRSEKIKSSNTLIPKFENANDYYKITVSDNGIGFDNKYAEEIFLAFKRLHSHNDFEGTGVGLSICKKIIEKHNGFITASSIVDHGSDFIIGLPEKQHKPSAVVKGIKQE